MADRLTGKVALVTGAASGMGAGCAEIFRQEGAIVIGVDRSGAARNCNLLDANQVENLARTIAEEHGRIDILVNAAAFAVFKWIDDLYFDEWKATMEGELDIVFHLTKASWPLLKASGKASIINLASANAHAALPGSPGMAHAAGKGGVLSMTRQLAMEGAAHGIRANSISPGFILTESNAANIKANPALEKAALEKNMIKRLGTPDDVAWCAVWLASDESAYVTGADIAVDAGATAW